MHENIIKSLINDFKNGLVREKISQPKFAERFYKEIVDAEATEIELEKHTDRFKKLLNKEHHKAPELLFAYINFFNERYGIDGKYSQGDKIAAWNMYVELDTRIATRKLTDGQTKAALSSLAQLFTKHREFAQEAGPNSRKYYQLATPVFEESLRPFTSKWHLRFESKKALSVEEDIKLREELVTVQIALTSLKDSLLDMSQKS